MRGQKSVELAVDDLHELLDELRVNAVAGLDAAADDNGIAVLHVVQNVVRLHACADDDGEIAHLFAHGLDVRRGDLLVEVAVSQHPIFRRQDYDIFSTVPVSFVQAALGATIRIDTIDGQVEYELKAGTQTDTQVRLRGKGVPSLRNKNVRGDHYVTFVVQVPTSMTKEQKEALQAFGEAMNGKTTANTTTTKKKHPIKDFFEKDKDK